MNEATFDVVAIGDALVDVIAHVEDEFLVQQGLLKGAMTLIDEQRAALLYGAMPPAIEMSGGSAGNTIVGVASLGGRAAYVGKVRDDAFGNVFQHDIRASGVAYDVEPAEDGPPTGRCLIAVTSDAQRTMQTFLGAAVNLAPDDVSPGLIRSAKITYLEGYLWDPPLAKEAFIKAARIAHEAGRQVALTLSDPFCVDRHRAEFVGLLSDHIDIVFANEHEIMSLYEVSTFAEALAAVRGHCTLAALTRSEKGSVLVSGEEIHHIQAAPVERVVDTTGAGDLYAAGVLYGLSRGLPLDMCGRIGSLAAAEVISHFGARPEMPLRELVQRELSGTARP